MFSFSLSLSLSFFPFLGSPVAARSEREKELEEGASEGHGRAHRNSTSFWDHLNHDSFLRSIVSSIHKVGFVEAV